MAARLIGRAALVMAAVWLVLIAGAWAVAPLLPSMGGIAFFSNDREAWRFGFIMQDVNRGTYLYPRMGHIRIQVLRATPDGEHMVYLRVLADRDIPNYLEMLDLVTRDRRGIPDYYRRGEGVYTRQFDISPDGAQIAYIHQNVAYIYDVATDDVTPLLERQFSGVDWSPDGETLALTVQQGGHSEIMLFDIATHDTRLLDDHAIAKYSAAFSPDGCCILYRGPNDRNIGVTTLYIMRLQSGAVQEINVQGTIMNEIVWSPGGTHIAYANQTAGYGGSFIEIMDIRTGETHRLSKNPANHSNLIWVR